MAINCACLAFLALTDYVEMGNVVVERKIPPAQYLLQIPPVQYLLKSPVQSAWQRAWRLYNRGNTSSTSSDTSSCASTSTFEHTCGHHYRSVHLVYITSWLRLIITADHNPRNLMLQLRPNIKRYYQYLIKVITYKPSMTQWQPMKLHHRKTLW